MNMQKLKDTIQQLFGGNKGLLAMDESTGTCNKRFAAVGIPQTIEMRRSYRELITTTPGLNESICGLFYMMKPYGSEQKLYQFKIVLEGMILKRI